MKVIIFALTILCTTPAIAENPFDNESFQQTLKEYTAGFNLNFSNLKGEGGSPEFPSPESPWIFKSKRQFATATSANIRMVASGGKYRHTARHIFSATSAKNAKEIFKMLEAALLKHATKPIQKVGGEISSSDYEPSEKVRYKMGNTEYYYEIYATISSGKHFLVFDMAVLPANTPLPVTWDISADIKTLLESAKNKFNSEVIINGYAKTSSLTVAGVPSYVWEKNKISFSFFTDWLDMVEQVKIRAESIKTLRLVDGLNETYVKGEADDFWLESYIFEDTTARVKFEVSTPNTKSENKHHAVVLTVSWY